MLCHVALCCTMLCHVVPCCAMLHYVVLCCTMLCYVALCCAMLCHVVLERFSFERRKVIGFAITMPHDWLKKLAPHFHPIRSKTKTNRNSLARVFPRFASATCNYYEF